jgi:hypothetical protein
MNKRKLLLSFIAVLLLITSQAQFHFGAKAGINAVKISGKTFQSGFDFNYLAGGFAEIGLGKIVSISPEVIFSQTTATRDSSSNYSALYNPNQMKATLNYLSIPILLNVKLAGPLYIEAGPQYSISFTSNKNLLQSGKEAFKSGDFSLIGGVKLKIFNIRISGRYLIGLNNIADATTQDKWKTQAIQVAIGYAF